MRQLQSVPQRYTALVSLLFVHVALLGWGAVVHSPTIDEIGWLASGLAHWKSGRLDIVINHPPHVGLVAASPLHLAGAETEFYEHRTASRTVGHTFMMKNGSRSFWFFTVGGWACIPFSVVGAVVCFTWARDLYGQKSGLLAATLWCFCPNILAHAQLVSHDVPAATCGLIATYAFWRWLQRCNLSRSLAASVALGLALLTKMTMLIHVAIWPLVWTAWTATSDKRRSIRGWIVECAVLAAILVGAIDVLNAGYAFQGSLAKLGSYNFRSELLGGSTTQRGNRFVGSLLGELPIPLPRPYVEGVDFQRYALEGGLPFQFSYLRGEWSTRGWAYYYLYALAIKVPLGTWCLLILSMLFRLRGLDGQSHARDEMVLLTPAVTLLLAASASPAWTDHLRYILPSFSFAFIWISRVAEVSWTNNRWLSCAAALALVWSVGSSLAVYPHSLSYFNELIGGPANGHSHLLSSNIDYGQDLLKLKRWFDRHPEARPFGLAYWDMESVDPHLAGIDFFVAPSGPDPSQKIDPVRAREYGPKPGWYAINVNLLHGDEWPGRRAFSDIGFYGYFLQFSPVARAGHSIYIYHLTKAETNRVRVQLGLPPIDPP